MEVACRDSKPYHTLPVRIRELAFASAHFISSLLCFAAVSSSHKTHRRRMKSLTEEITHTHQRRTVLEKSIPSRIAYRVIESHTVPYRIVENICTPYRTDTGESPRYPVPGYTVCTAIIHRSAFMFHKIFSLIKHTRSTSYQGSDGRSKSED